MKKITFLFALFISAVSIQAQSTLSSSSSTGTTVFINQDANRAPVIITQSNTQTIEVGQEIACASPTSFRDNNLFRSFDLAGDFGIVNGLQVNAVEFAMGTITTPAGFEIFANIYSTTPGSFPGGTLTLQGTAVYFATNADAFTMINLPLAAVIPAGEEMVMELVLFDDGTDTNFMRFGCNNDGQTGPSYIQAVDCGAATPTDFTTLGLTQGLVWNVLGDDEILSTGSNLLSQVAVYPNPTSTTLNLKVPSTVEVNKVSVFDLLGRDTGVSYNDGVINTSNLSQGVYLLKVQTSAGTYTQKVVKQ
ncbi:T9SS type A sorting domain-containing protein [Aequorivita sp. CIP111184]|uniref:T9SS type A sorting domain-containing protein n=1 Tax=Aequorivita sp. CIP111184 TaxID=2211356 RepID=UPI000DBC2C76|nr:T9SS type A sorting domain-containing protein [Aequorivita sp. CIP111184]SRX54055.1 hypothetical protein AEQU1_01085 [Aequorivita sp. CIP111184]